MLQVNESRVLYILTSDPTLFLSRGFLVDRSVKIIRGIATGDVGSVTRPKYPNSKKVVQRFGTLKNVIHCYVLNERL